MRNEYSEKQCQSIIEEAVSSGFSSRCAVRYASEEICADFFLETGKDARKQIRRMQNVLCGGEIYEHPRKARGWFSYPAAWKALFLENVGVDAFCTMAGMSNDSVHRAMFVQMMDDKADLPSRGAKIFLYCLVNQPFEYGNTMAGRLLSASFMAGDTPLFFAGISQGLCPHRKRLEEMMRGIRTGQDFAFADFVALWKQARLSNLREATKVVEFWKKARERTDDRGVLEFYMSALGDNKVRESSEWARFAHISHEDAARHMDVLCQTRLAVKRKSGYEILAVQSAA